MIPREIILTMYEAAKALRIDPDTAAAWAATSVALALEAPWGEA